MILAIGVVLLGRAPGAWACSCAAPTYPEVFERATLVFSGTAQSKREVVLSHGAIENFAGIEWTFNVDSTQKGKTGSVQRVTSGIGGGDCGYSFEIGKRYQVFARPGGPLHDTGICSGTHPLAGAQPIPETGGSGNYWGILVALAAGAGGAIGIHMGAERLARRA